MFAAIYASRAQLEPLVVDGPQPGGQLTITTDVENYPGFAGGIMGPELMNEFRAQAERFGTKIINVWIDKVDLSKRPFTLYGKESPDSAEFSTIIKADTLIVSTGASAKWLGIPGEAPMPEGLGGNGVSACATCDGFFFRGKAVVVVGGGDTAMEEADFLTRYADKVYLIHRRDELRASKIMADRALKNPKIKIQWNTAVASVEGNDKDGRRDDDNRWDAPVEREVHPVATECDEFAVPGEGLGEHLRSSPGPHDRVPRERPLRGGRRRGSADGLGQAGTARPRPSRRGP